MAREESKPRGDDGAVGASSRASSIGTATRKATRQVSLTKTNYEGRVTIYVLFTSVVAASAGLIIGYDLGVSGGVIAMGDFLRKFFPAIYRNRRNSDLDNYCLFDSHVLQLFTSSLYLAGALATLPATFITRVFGRTASMFVGGVFCMAGAILNGAAQNLSMLIIGRILLGIGIGFGGQAVPLYLSEMSIPTWRGFFNIMFQSALTLGILFSNLINYGTERGAANGWRISLVLVVIPAVVLTLGGIFLPDSPPSLVQRGQIREGRKVLERIRGIGNVDTEFRDLLDVSRVTNAVEFPWYNLFVRSYRPQLVMAVFLPAFQQLSGNNVINFYAPVLFQTLGLGSDAALLSAVILGLVRVVSSWIAMILSDRVGRRILLLQGGIQMAISQVAVTVILRINLGNHGNLAHGLTIGVITLFCVFLSGFDWSWGPLAWLIPSEIFPLEIRSAAQSVAIASNYLFTFLIGQLFLTIFCHFKAFTFIFFASWVIFMTSFAWILLPETKSIPLEDMRYIWSDHWLWQRYSTDAQVDRRKSAAGRNSMAAGGYPSKAHRDTNSFSSSQPDESLHSDAA